MRKRITALIVLAVMLVAIPVATAQESSPEATGESLLAGLGYPELQAGVDGELLEFPSELESNRYRMVLTNSSTEFISEVILARAPEGITIDDAVALAEEAAVSEAPSDEFYSLTFVGGSTAFNESVNDVIVTLAPGSYIAMSLQWEVADPEVPGPTTVAPFEVTGELPELTDPEASVFVNAFEMTIDMPDTISAGPQIWQFDNTGAFVHLIEITTVTQEYAPEEIQATLDFFFEIPATPGAEDVELVDEAEEFPRIDLLNVLSPQQTTWYEVTLEPGNYIAFCWVGGPGDVPPHALLGMFKVFTVE